MENFSHMTKLVSFTIEKILFYSRLWMIRRPRSLNCPQEQLVDTYIKQVRSIMEMACPAWHPTLTKADSSILERVQKLALNIILGSRYTWYESAPDIFELDTLEERRGELCLNFAWKSAAHPIHSKWFLKTNGEQSTRNHNTYQPVWARTGRFWKSPFPHMTNILNEHCRKKKWKTEYSLVMYICMHSPVTMDHKSGCL